MKHLVELGVQLTGAVLLQEGIGTVANDGQQPGTRIVTAESVKEAECAHNGLLRDILGVVVVAQKPTSEVVPCPHVGQHHCLERVDSMRQYPSERKGPTAATTASLTLFPSRRKSAASAGREEVGIGFAPTFSDFGLDGAQSCVARRRSSCSSRTWRVPK